MKALWVLLVILHSASTARAGPCAPPNQGGGTVLVVCPGNSIQLGAPVAFICGFNAWPQTVVLSMVGTGNLATVFYANGSYYLTASDNVLPRLLAGIWLPRGPPAYDAQTTIVSTGSVTTPLTATTAARQNAASFVLFKFLRTMLSDSGTYFCTANGVNSSASYVSIDDENIADDHNYNQDSSADNLDEMVTWLPNHPGQSTSDNDNDRRILIIAITVPLVFIVLAAVALAVVVVLCRKKNLKVAAQQKADEIKGNDKDEMKAEEFANVEAYNNKIYEAPPPTYDNVAVDPTNYGINIDI